MPEIFIKNLKKRGLMNPVISGGVYLGNDTSHERFADNFKGN